MGPLGPEGSVSPTWEPHGFGQVPLHAWALGLLLICPGHPFGPWAHLNPTAWALGFVFLGIGPLPPPPLPVALYMV